MTNTDTKKVNKIDNPKIKTDEKGMFVLTIYSFYLPPDKKNKKKTPDLDVRSSCPVVFCVFWSVCYLIVVRLPAAVVRDDIAGRSGPCQVNKTSNKTMLGRPCYILLVVIAIVTMVTLYHVSCMHVIQKELHVTTQHHTFTFLPVQNADGSTTTFRCINSSTTPDVHIDIDTTITPNKHTYTTSLRWESMTTFGDQNESQTYCTQPGEPLVVEVADGTSVPKALVVSKLLK